MKILVKYKFYLLNLVVCKSTSISLLLFLSIALLFIQACAINAKNIKTENNHPQVAVSDDGKEYYADRILIGYVYSQKINEIARMIDGEVVVHIPEIKAVSIKIKTNIERALLILQSQGIKERYGIRYAEYVYVRNIVPYECCSSFGVSEPKKMFRGLNEYENYTGESLDFYLWGLRAIDVSSVWKSGYDGKGIVVAVLDTGVDGTHPDLQGQVIEGYRPTIDMILPAGTDSSYGGSHGTHVVGTIAAKKDGKGIVGVAPGAKIMPIVLFDNGGWYVGDDFAAKGIVWAVNHGAKVLSNSWGGAGYSQTLKDAIDYALENDVVVVAAAGNSKSIQSYQYPANYPGVIQVGAAEFNGGDYTVADFSSGSPAISVCAPGVAILSTMPQKGSFGYDKRAFEYDDNAGYYGFMSGTSMATPHVSGLTALILQKFPNAKPWQVRKIIEMGSLDIDLPGPDEKSGYGLIQSNSLNKSFPNVGGVDYQVVITDAYGNWKIPSVFVSLVGTSETGRKMRYFAKTNAEGIAKLLGIDAGEYDVIIGGPDFVEETEGLIPIVNRRAEERQFAYHIFLNSEPATLTVVKFSSQAKLELEESITNAQVVFVDITKLATEVGYETVLPLLGNSADFSKLSGRFKIEIRIPQPSTADLTIRGAVIMNGVRIPITGKISENTTETYISDGYPNLWWTVFGKL